MEIVDTTQINRFASMPEQTGFVKLSENTVFTLTASQLQAIIKEAIEEATAPILQKVQDLRDEVTRLKNEKVAALEKHAVGMDDWTESYGRNYAYLAQKVNKMETTEEKPTEHGSKIAQHLNDIYEALNDRAKSCAKSAQKWDFMAFWEAAEMLGLSHRRISQLAEIARNDPRFIIAWHPKKQNMKIFRINPFTLGNMSSLIHGAFKAGRDERVDGLLKVS